MVRLTALVMLLAALTAWSGLVWLVFNVPPTRSFALPAGYVFAFTAITSTGALLAWVIRGPRHDGEWRSPASYLAHSMLLGVIALFAFWLQSLRVLTPTVAVLLIGLYAFLELAILFGTRGSWELPLRR